jgi:hypothetical protein
LAGRGWRRWLPPALVDRGRRAAEGPRLALIHLPRTGGTAIQHHLESIAGQANVVRVALPPDFLEQLADLRSTPIVLGHYFYPMVRLVPGAAVATVVREPVERSISVWEYLQWQTKHPDHQRLASRDIHSLDDFAEDAELGGHVRDNQTRLLGVEYDVEAIVAAFESGEICLEEARSLAAEAESEPADEAMLARAKQRLGQMVVVGVTEELPDFVRVLEGHVGLGPGRVLQPDNASPPDTVERRGETYDGATRQRLAEINAFDVELYRFARQLWDSQREPIGDAG